jgi:beta-glucosidase
MTPNLTPEEAAAKKKADMMISAFLDDMPVYKIHAFSEGRFTEQRLEEVLSRVQ